METAQQPQTWLVQEGAMVAPTLDPHEVCRQLQRLNVVAEIDWYPQTSHLLGLNVLLNKDGAVAALDTADADYRVGMTLTDMCRSLSRTFNAEVQIGDVTSNDIPAQAAFPAVKDIEHKLRAVEITSMPASSVPFAAAAEGRDMGYIQLQGQQRAVLYELSKRDYVVGAMCTTTPAVAFFVSPDEAQMVAVTASGQTDAESLAIHSWTMLTRVVAGAVGSGDEAVCRRVRADLGHLENPHIVASLVEGADADALAEAFARQGREGLIEALKALHLPAAVASYLYGHIDLDEVPGAEVCSPKGLRQVLGSSADIWLSHDPQQLSRLVRLYRKAYVEQPWVGRGVALAEAALAAGMITAFARASDSGSVWRKLAGIGGGMLLADSVMGVSLGAYLSDRLRRTRPGHKQES